MRRFVIGKIFTALLAIAATAAERDFFCIEIVDQATGRGVPMVELTTVNHIRYYTDSAGIVAFSEPGLMNQRVFFHIRSHGYEYPKDGFGYRGTRLTIEPGGHAKLKIKRINIAERLYRVTGAGIYRDSLLVGRPAPIVQPLLNAQVFGSDSVVTAIYQGKLHWFWGDTNRPSYPLGNFHVPGAVSQLPHDGGLDPSVGVDLQYFVDDRGFARPMAQMPGEGPTWINGLVVIDEGDRQRMFATFVKVQPPLKVYRRGLAKFDDQAGRFEEVAQFDMQSPLFPGGHPFKHAGEDGVQYVYFGNPFPLVRVRARVDDLRDLSKYEAYTCLKQGSRLESLQVVHRDGMVQYDWKPDTIPWTPKLQSQLIRDGQIKPADGLFQLQDDEGKPILIHSGSVAWNPYRQRWIMIGLQSFGSSLLGEIWYAEADQMVGPWMGARKIVTHDRYSFYNPKHHVAFDQDNGRLIYFEGTYTAMFSGNEDRTPRYNYNQIMYRLDLSDPQLR